MLLLTRVTGSRSLPPSASRQLPVFVLSEPEKYQNTQREAVNKTTYSDGDSSSHWHFTLMNKDGDVLKTTHPEQHFKDSVKGQRFKHHFVSLCQYINK